MTTAELDAAVQAAKDETKTALENILSELNHGQRKKLAENPAVRALLERYGVEVES